MLAYHLHFRGIQARSPRCDVSRTKLIRLAGAATGTIVVLGTLSSAVLLVASSGGVAGGEVSAVAWYVPVLAGASIAGLMWAMLSARHSDADGDIGLGVNSCCTACGGTIHSDWRLCPHCGERLPGTGSRQSRS